jgi:hypothetical protein
VLKLLQSATFLVAVGVLRAGDPAGYEEMMSAIGAGDVLWFARNVDRLIELTAWQIFMAAGVLGSAVMVGWVLLNWGAYRTLAGFSRARSAAALLLFVIGAVPVFVVVTLFATALISLEL